MPELDLDELERLHAEATPGPWVTDSDSLDNFPRTIFAGDNIRVSLATKNNAAYIVAACNSLPALIKRVRELERQRGWLAERLNFICHSDTDCVLGCPDVMNGNCSNVTRSQWIEASKDATSYVNKL